MSSTEIKIKTDFIEKVIGMMKANELSEVTLEDASSSLYIKMEERKFASEPPQAENPAAENTIAPAEENKKIVPVVSNMIGIFYIKPRPEAAPFVQTGSRVEKGQQLCIIETIKLMNNITAPVSGTIKEICIENGRPAEYGQTIMYIEQD